MAATFSAALLAGGQSRRMGRDKALLPVDGHAFLWQRQLELLEELGPRRIFWSGFPRAGLAAATITVVADRVPDAGPLAGIAACLEELETELLVVLAVDLPRMTVPFLRRLLVPCTESQGAVPRRNGRFEPLAAAYPKAILPLARRHLAEGRLALQEFASAGIAGGWLRAFDVAAEEGVFFHNLNRPEDLEVQP
jgi:molybdopterin-guanine dinucleotide biosynthesis protein A